MLKRIEVKILQDPDHSAFATPGQIQIFYPPRYSGVHPIFFASVSLMIKVRQVSATSLSGEIPAGHEFQSIERNEIIIDGHEIGDPVFCADTFIGQGKQV